MKKRIFCSMVALVGSAMALCFIFITGLLYEHYSNLQAEQLKETASYIEQGYEAAGQSYLETLQTGTNRVTLIAKDGTVLYDSQEQDVSQMGNHADREEVQQAEQDGVGFSRRFSSTMSKETVYYAVRLSDQSVLRVSVEYRSLFAMMGVLLMQALFILLVMLILVCTLSEAMMNGQWRSRMVYLAALALGTLLLYFGMLLAAPGAMDLYRCLLVVTLLSLIFVAIYAFRANLRNIFITIGLFLTAMLFVPTTDYIFNSNLKEHQQNRILSFLGLVSDPLGTDYNVNQAKIAIGSGGWIGKGFLQGTQIKYGFVPEKHTDFIFCTIGEEWGFLGAMLLLTLFCLLIFRLMRMGERQEEPFGRIYCYCVAAFLLFHLLVNVGMTIGLMPVMGIPLPLVSYGGSSLMAFTIMLFIAVRLDASTRQYSFR